MTLTSRRDLVRLSLAGIPAAVGVDCWGVVSLEHDGRSTSWWDDVELVPLS